MVYSTIDAGKMKLHKNCGVLINKYKSATHLSLRSSGQAARKLNSSNEAGLIILELSFILHLPSYDRRYHFCIFNFFVFAGHQII